MRRLQRLLELLEALDSQDDGLQPGRAFGRSPIVCGCCGADTVLPLGIEEAGEYSWHVRMRCGSCGTWAEEEIGDAEAAELGDQLDR